MGSGSSRLSPEPATQTVCDVGGVPALSTSPCSTPTSATRRERGLFCALGRDDGRWTYPVDFCESSLISTQFTRLGEPEIRRTENPPTGIQAPFAAEGWFSLVSLKGPSCSLAIAWTEKSLNNLAGTLEHGPKAGALIFLRTKKLESSACAKYAVQRVGLTLVRSGPQENLR